MGRMDRRAFVRASMGVAAGAVVGPGLVEALAARAASGGRGTGRGGGYGPIAPRRPVAAVGVDPDIELLALPDGFDYAVFGVSGTVMSDGTPTPYAHDGMGAFRAPRGRIRLVRNHEVRDGPGVVPPLAADAAYDPLAGGGTTTLELRIDGDGVPEVVRDFVSLAGTHTNCAGGVTPWGTWLSCEETTVGPPEFGQKHGYVFEVAADANGPVEATPLLALGRFVHEAACVDPSSGVVYLTEDSADSGLYRFVPTRHRRGRRPDLTEGRLQMLAVAGQPGSDARTGQTVGAALDAEWVDIEEPDPPAGGKAVYEEGSAKGAATFGRLEGCDLADGTAYFVCTDGGDAGHGQLWSYRPRGPERGRLTLRFESPGADALSYPDNVSVTPRGGILLCEDTEAVRAGGTRPEQHLRGLTRDGGVFPFASNLTDASEWAGACWSPDGAYLFANTFGFAYTAPDAPTSRTYAIWGPWRRGPL